MRIVLSFLAALAFLSSPLTALAQANTGLSGFPCMA